MHLAIGKLVTIDTFLHGGDNVRFLHIAGFHISGTHTGDRSITESIATSVSSRSHPIMLGTDAVVQITGQDIGFLAFHTLIVEIHGSTIESDGTVIHHVDMLIAHLLSQKVAENGSTFTVEVSLKSMSYGFVQQDTRTASPHHDGHFATFGFHSLEQDSSLIHRLTCNNIHDVIRHEFKTLAVRTTGITVLHLSILFHDTDCHKRNHRTVVVVAHALGITEQHVRCTVRKRSLHLTYTIVQRENLFVQLF